MQVISVAAVITNSALISFVGSQMARPEDHPEVAELYDGSDGGFITNFNLRLDTVRHALG